MCGKDVCRDHVAKAGPNISKPAGQAVGPELLRLQGLYPLPAPSVAHRKHTQQGLLTVQMEKALEWLVPFFQLSISMIGMWMNERIQVIVGQPGGGGWQ